MPVFLLASKTLKTLNAYFSPSWGGGGEGKGRENLFLKIFEREDVDEVVLDERQVDQFPGGE